MKNTEEEWKQKHLKVQNRLSSIREKIFEDPLEWQKREREERILIKDWNTIIPLYSEEMKKLTSGDSQPLKAAALQLTFFEAVSKNKPEILYNEIISYR